MSLVILIPTLLRGNQFIKIQQNMNNDNNQNLTICNICIIFLFDHLMDAGAGRTNVGINRIDACSGIEAIHLLLGRRW